MFFLTLEIISLLLWALALPPMLVALARIFKPLSKVDKIKKTGHWMHDKLLAADKAGEAKRGEGDKLRPIGPVVDTCCGMSVSFFLLFAITPWAWLNPWLLVGFLFYYLAFMPLAGFLQNLYLLRFGYVRLDNDDDGDGGAEKPSPEPPPFDGFWRQGPRGGRGQRREIKTRDRERGCPGQKQKERPLVSPGPR